MSNTRRFTIANLRTLREDPTLEISGMARFLLAVADTLEECLPGVASVVVQRSHTAGRIAVEVVDLPRYEAEAILRELLKVRGDADDGRHS